MGLMAYIEPRVSSAFDCWGVPDNHRYQCAYWLLPKFGLLKKLFMVLALFCPLMYLCASVGNSGSLPALLPDQIRKLKQLSVLTLAESSKVQNSD